MLFRSIRLSRHRETVAFSRSLSLAWFEQLLSERRVIKKIGGKPVRRFERIGGMAAEALDCTVYAIAARQLTTTIDLDRREQELSAADDAAKPKRKLWEIGIKK